MCVCVRVSNMLRLFIPDHTMPHRTDNTRSIYASVQPSSQVTLTSWASRTAQVNTLTKEISCLLAQRSCCEPCEWAPDTCRQDSRWSSDEKASICHITCPKPSLDETPDRTYTISAFRSRRRHRNPLVQRKLAGVTLRIDGTLSSIPSRIRHPLEGQRTSKNIKD